MSDDDLLNYEAEDLLDDVLLDDKLDEDDLLLSDEELEAENAVQDVLDVRQRRLITPPQPVESPIPSPTPGPAAAEDDFVQEVASEPSPEGSGTVSSTPEKVPQLLVASTENDLVDSSTSTPDAVVPVAAKESTNEVSSTEGSIPDYSVDLKVVTSSSTTDASSTPDSKSSQVVFKTPATSEVSEVVSSVEDTPKSLDAETTEDDERHERINPKTSVEKYSDEAFVDNRKRPLQPGELPGIVPLYHPRSDSAFPHPPNMNYPHPGMRPGFGSRPPYGVPYHPGMRPGPPRLGSGMFRHQMRPGMRPFMPPGAAQYAAGPPVPVPPIVQPPQKVLINPNFKGGVEAVTNQLMKDRHLLAGIARPLSDEELLRQQEEFITRNLIQVEKRRHETSPPPRKRSRSRTRSRSPERRRRSRSRSPYRGGRYNRDRRPPWRRNQQDNWGKRRRSADRDNKRDEHEDEDEETRVYREKIEKQKAMREKILRDKEKRRKEAIEAEKKQKEQDEQKRRDDEASLKCTPIVVTGKKIISLKSIKSKTSDDEEKPTASLNKTKSPPEPTPPSSKSDPEDAARTTAVVKPFQSKTTRPVFDDIDEKLERELLEEESTTPPPPLPPIVANPNRRVVIRKEEDGGSPLAAAKRSSQDVVAALEDRRVRVFDRISNRKGALGNESKRKIQRIVVNTSE